MRLSTRVIRFVGHQTAVPRWPHIARLTALSVTGVIVFVITATPSAPQPIQDFLSGNIDLAVSPRVDFFHYAGGEWLKRNPIPNDQSTWGIGNVFSSELYARLRTISEEAAAKTGAPGSAEQLIGDVWATGMDAAAINSQRLAPLRPDLDRISGIRALQDFVDVVATLHRRNMATDNYFLRQRVLFDDGVEPDELDSRRRIYYLSQAGLTMGRPAYTAKDPPRVKIQAAFREYLFRTFLRIGADADRARTGADAVYDLETRLAAAFEQGNVSRRLRLADLKQLAPTIGWDRYFQQIGATGLDLVEVRQPGFFRALDGLLQTTPLEVLKDYLRFWLIKVNAPFLDDETYGEFFAYKGAVTGRLEPEPRWRRVVWQEKNWLGLPLARLYGEADLPPETTSRHRAVAESIRKAFRDRIANLEWMSDGTKSSARLKLDRLRITIGYPDSGVDFSTMQLRRDSYVLNMIRSAEWFHAREIERLNAVANNEVDLHPNIGGGAEYVPGRNEVRIPNPVNVPGIRDRDLDDAVVYGATWFGHEIAHALDSLGRHYGADGNKIDWWTAADAAAFEERAQVLVDQYSAFVPIAGLPVDGRTTLSENMADVVGLRIALDAFKQTDQFKRNERIGTFTPLQRFFLAFAYARTFHERPETVANRLRGGAYAPHRERVNGPLMNIPEFYEAFDVRPGDPMYRPERARVRVW